MGQCGLSPLEAIAAATINSAEIIGLDDSLGSIEKVKKADLLLLKNNPLNNLALLSDQNEIPVIIKDGIVVKNR